MELAIDEGDFLPGRDVDDDLAEALVGEDGDDGAEGGVAEVAEDRCAEDAPPCGILRDKEIVGRSGFVGGREGRNGQKDGEEKKERGFHD